MEALGAIARCIVIILAVDLGESNDLARQEPQRVAEMSRLLEQLIDHGRRTAGPHQKNDVNVRRYPQTGNPAKPKAKKKS